MFNQELFNKICTGTCTFEELENFVTKIDKKEFDLDNAFVKYYSLERILFVINKYNKKQISAKLLAYWANAYNWIIMSGFKVSSHNEGNTCSMKEILIDEISDSLDSLSFFDDDEEWFNTNNYIEVFSTLDEIYKNIQEWELHYAPTSEFCDEPGDMWILFINIKKGQYLKIFYGGFGDFTIENQEPWRESDIEKAIQSLKANGYQEMPYGDFLD